MTLRRDTAIILIPSYEEERGTTRFDFSNATRVVETGWRLQPSSGSENETQSRQGVISTYRAFGPYDTALTSHSRMIFGDYVYEVDGPVHRWPSPTGALVHSEVNLKVVDG
jgi:hypothetical protein